MKLSLTHEYSGGLNFSFLDTKKILPNMRKHNSFFELFYPRSYMQLIKFRLVDSNWVSDTILDLSRWNVKPYNCSNNRLEYDT
jgi:hypothetical protein